MRKIGDEVVIKVTIECVLIGKDGITYSVKTKDSIFNYSIKETDILSPQLTEVSSD